MTLLKRNLKRLRDQKVVEIINKNGQEIVKLTQKGQTKYLKFKLFFNNAEFRPIQRCFFKGSLLNLNCYICQN